MPFAFARTPLSGLTVVHPRVFADGRGYFLESYKQSDFASAGINHAFVQDNHSYSTRGVLRGIHYQTPPHVQAKLVGVVEGSVWDVAVDLRKDSSTFGEWFALELNSDNQTMLFIPKGFGHAFVVLSETVHFLYKCTAEYDKPSEAGVRWNDPELGIEWPISDVVVSEKDAALPALADAPIPDWGAP